MIVYPDKPTPSGIVPPILYTLARNTASGNFISVFEAGEMRQPDLVVLSLDF